MGHEYLCVFTSPDGSEELDAAWGALGANMMA